MPATSKQHAAYQAKLDAIAQGSRDVTFAPAEFMHYVGHLNGMDAKALGLRLGGSADYANQVLRTLHQQLNAKLQGKLAYLTNTDAELWSRKSYGPADAEHVRFDPEKKSTDIKRRAGSYRLQAEHDTAAKGGIEKN